MDNLCGRVYRDHGGAGAILRCDRAAGHTPATEHRNAESGSTWRDEVSIPPSEQTVGSREWMEARAVGRHPGTVHLIRLFAWAHLPPHLQSVSAHCAELAVQMLLRLSDGPELTTGLRKLLEAKDCFVRQALEG